MTDTGIEFRSADEFPPLRDRAAAARARASLLAERYVQLRRRSELVVHEARDLCAVTSELRDRLRDSVATYVVVLRRTDVSPERAIILVKSAMIESDSCPDKHHRHLVEEAVRWAVDAYYAA